MLPRITVVSSFENYLDLINLVQQQGYQRRIKVYLEQLFTHYHNNIINNKKNKNLINKTLRLSVCLCVCLSTYSSEDGKSHGVVGCKVRCGILQRGKIANKQGKTANNYHKIN